MANIVRSRCLRFISLLHEEGFEELPLNDAIYLFQTQVGILDRRSITSYFGQHELRQKTILDKTTRYQNGTVSMAQTEIYRRLIQKSGYFEILDLAEIKRHEATNRDQDQLFFCPNPDSIVKELKISFSPPHPHSSNPLIIEECQSVKKHGKDLCLSPNRYRRVGELEGFDEVSSSNNVSNSNNNNLRGEIHKTDYAVINDEKEPELEINPLTGQPPLIIQDHTENELFKVYENAANNSLLKQTNHVDTSK